MLGCVETQPIAAISKEECPAKFIRRLDKRNASDNLTNNFVDVVEGSRVENLRSAAADDDVVDGDVDELDEEADEAHDGEADRGGKRDLLVLLTVRLSALLHEADRVLRETLRWVHHVRHVLHCKTV